MTCPPVPTLLPLLPPVPVRSPPVPSDPPEAEPTVPPLPVPGVPLPPLAPVEPPVLAPAPPVAVTPPLPPGSSPEEPQPACAATSSAADARETSVNCLIFRPGRQGIVGDISPQRGRTRRNLPDSPDVAPVWRTAARALSPVPVSPPVPVRPHCRSRHPWPTRRRLPSSLRWGPRFPLRDCPSSSPRTKHSGGYLDDASVRSARPRNEPCGNRARYWALRIAASGS